MLAPSKTGVAIGTPLDRLLTNSATSLFESFDINNGDIISIVSNIGNVSVTVSGEAQGSGNLGDLIKVKNLKSGKIIKGYIKKDKKIKIFR